MRLVVNSRLLCFAFLFAAFCLPLLSQTNYYISPDGNNNNNGTSQDSPWATISKFNEMSFNPGDSILFERDGVWRVADDQEVKLTSSGEINNHIVVGAYGKGLKPKILGSIAIPSWNSEGDGIWSADLGYNPRELDYGAELFFLTGNSTALWGLSVDYTASHSNLLVDLDWSWNNNKVYVKSSTNPSDRFLSIEAPKKNTILYLNDQEHITIENLEIAYAINTGIYDNYKPSNISGLKIKYCHIHHIGHKDSGSAYGISARHSDMLISRNEINDCGRRAISLTTYDNTPQMQISNIVIYKNYLHDGWHTTGIDLNTQGSHVVSDVFIHNNKFMDPPETNLQRAISGKSLTSNHIFIANQGTGVIEDIMIYNNLFFGHHGNGILIQDIENVYIYFNTFYKFNSTLLSYAGLVVAGGSESNNIIAKNNIFYDNGLQSSNKDLYSLDVKKTDSEFFYSDYNLFYEEDETNRTIMVENPGGSPRYYIYNITEFSDYTSTHDRDKNSIAGENPKFINGDIGDFQLEDDSPARGAGTPIEGITTDYYGSPRDAISPSIGAIEYNPNPFIDVEEAFSNEIIIFPNPASASGRITVSSQPKSTIRIYDIKGNLLFEKYLISEKETISPELKKGFYILLAIAKDMSIHSEKLIIY